jgi:hypothetical protein
MVTPTHHDSDYAGNTATELLAVSPKGTGVWCEASLDDVQENIMSTGYPKTLTRYVQGRVEDTLYTETPSDIAILRLDTDWFESTRLELQILFPLVRRGGVVIIDDYGHWRGSRKAVDEYFSTTRLLPFLARIDYTCRAFVKTI